MEFADEESVTAVLTQELLPSLNGKRLTVKERTVNKAALQVKLQKSRKRKRNDSQQDSEGLQEEMASFLSEDFITKLKSTPTVGGSLILVHIHCIIIWGITNTYMIAYCICYCTLIQHNGVLFSLQGWYL